MCIPYPSPYPPPIPWGGGPLTRDTTPYIYTRIYIYNQFPANIIKFNPTFPGLRTRDGCWTSCDETRPGGGLRTSTNNYKHPFCCGPSTNWQFTDVHSMDSQYCPDTLGHAPTFYRHLWAIGTCWMPFYRVRAWKSPALLCKAAQSSEPAMPANSHLETPSAKAYCGPCPSGPVWMGYYPMYCPTL